jgi:hypothetical protein
MGKFFVLPTTDPIFPSWLLDPIQMLVHLTLGPGTQNKYEIKINAALKLSKLQNVSMV